jgi:hypothetical protein
MRRIYIDNRKEGDERIIEKFLFLPFKIGNEMRWLENVKIRQVRRYMFDVTCGSSWYEWKSVEWL